MGVETKSSLQLRSGYRVEFLPPHQGSNRSGVLSRLEVLNRQLETYVPPVGERVELSDSEHQDGRLGRPSHYETLRQRDRKYMV